jgi:hypothetical protein
VFHLDLRVREANILIFYQIQIMISILNRLSTDLDRDYAKDSLTRNCHNRVGNKFFFTKYYIIMESDIKIYIIDIHTITDADVHYVHEVFPRYYYDIYIYIPYIDLMLGKGFCPLIIVNDDPFDKRQKGVWETIPNSIISYTHDSFLINGIAIIRCKDHGIIVMRQITEWVPELSALFSNKHIIIVDTALWRKLVIIVGKRTGILRYATPKSARKLN